VDVLVAVGADDERFAPHFRHEVGPRGLPGSGLAELPEPVDPRERAAIPCAS
jgi:hypothetical protein